MTQSDDARRARAGLLRDLHHRADVLVLPNVWDAQTAKIFEQAGFPALATPSSGIADSLGYADRQLAPATEMFAAAARIIRSVGVPVTVDAEAGYGLTPAELAERLAETGAAGCNLEDTAHPQGTLVAIEEQAEWLAAVRAADPHLVINARVDSFLRGKGPVEELLQDAITRAEAYLAAGADCVYPILAPTAVLGELTERIPGPVNAMFLPNGPSLAELAELGIARVTFGGQLYDHTLGLVRQMAERLTAGQNPLA
ncbi:isocitrate lyase/phosphoenolpyruvate mutase family protein [Thermopolyspora sp. NPDC052614]|uniref:isocitrate lyase/PEP mutase family protein n=1 Tax=Thermopolyspora sp. NPDC052614 TaxID=3155682 RepID=UPI0034301929